MSDQVGNQNVGFLTSRLISIQSFLFLIPKFQATSIIIGCIGRIVSDLVGNPEDRFSRDTDHYHSVKTVLRANSQDADQSAHSHRLVSSASPSYFLMYFASSRSEDVIHTRDKHFK